MSVYLFEFQEENKRKFYKIITVLFVISTALAGMVFYFIYNDYPFEPLSVTRVTCEVEVSQRLQIESTGSIEDLKAKIEQAKNYTAGSLIYRQLANSEHCDGSGSGLWFDYPQEWKKFVYCLSPYDRKVVEFNTKSCREVGDEVYIKESADQLTSLFKGE